MSDHDTAPDPIDAAYVKAESMLSDETARLARRQRVLSAIARQPVALPTRASPKGRSLWRRGSWLVAACVAGLSLFLTTQLYRPVSPPPQPAPNTRPAAGLGTSSIAASSGPSVSATANSAAPPRATTARPAALRAAAASVVGNTPARPPAPAVESKAQEPVAFPAAEAAPPAPSPPVAAGQPATPPPAANQTLAAGSVSELVVVGEKREQNIERVPVAVSAFTGRSREVVTNERPELGAKLRAAAAAGQTHEVEALLRLGAPVDAPDANGDTALMKSIEADRPAAAALLRRHGASLDSPNKAGESARDMATKKGDAELTRAIGLGPGRPDPPN